VFLDSFRVKNFKIHRDTSIDLFPITVFVGRNGGGKSAFFDALVNFSMVSRGRISQAFGPGPYSFRAAKHRGAGPAERIGFEAVLSQPPNDHKLSYSISYGQVGMGEEGAYVIYDERLTDEKGRVLYDRASPGDSHLGGTLRHVLDDRSIFAAIRSAQFAGDYVEEDPLVTLCAREISRISKFRLDPDNLARPSKIPDVLLQTESGGASDLQASAFIPRLDYRGEDLPGVLYFLSETHDPAFDAIVGSLQKVLDGFDGFEFNSVATDRIGFSVRYVDERGIIPAANLSDGTLTVIGLHALLLHPERPAVLCMEEPENGLTPNSMRAIYHSIRGLAFDESPDRRCQVLISSHSPFIICEAWNGEDRDFIYRFTPTSGRAELKTFANIIEDHKIHLRKEKGKRANLGLEIANLVMEGIYD
jgi:predicted ATPase